MQARSAWSPANSYEMSVGADCRALGWRSLFEAGVVSVWTVYATEDCSRLGIRGFALGNAAGFGIHLAASSDLCRSWSGNAASFTEP